MIKLTNEQINEIIDSTKPHAKIVCDRTYQKVIQQIGNNDHFKTILDASFDKICDPLIDQMKQTFSKYFTENKKSDISVGKIYEIFYNDQPVYQAPRGAGNTLSVVVLCTIQNSIKQAFVEKLAEYNGIDISDIINY